VESALGGVTASELLSALCVHAHETADALAQKTAAIDISKDAEKLRYDECVNLIRFKLLEPALKTSCNVVLECITLY